MPMWVLFAILGAISKASTSVIRKKIATSNPAIYVLISSVITTFILFGMTLVMPSESASSIFNAPTPLVLSGIVQIVAIRANMFAFKHEELSYITPMFALTPLYTAFIGYFTIGEKPSAIGSLGIFAIVIGVYIVTSKKDIGIKETFNHILKNKGARAGMLVPLTYAVSAILNKDALNKDVTPIASVLAIMAVMGIGHLYIVKSHSGDIVSTFKDTNLIRLILLASVFGVGSVAFASLALNDAFASYTLSIRRLDVLITVIIGAKFMGDSNFSRRITGAALMTLGVVLVSIS